MTENRLIPIQDCRLFIKIVQERGQIILGMEGFTAIDGKILPDMEMIADFSSIGQSDKADEEKSHDSIRAAERIIDVWLAEKKGDRSIDFVIKNQAG